MNTLKSLGVSGDILNLPKYIKEAYLYYRVKHDANPGFEKKWWDEHYNEVKDWKDFKDAVNKIGIENYKKQFLLAASQWIADSDWLLTGKNTMWRI